MEQLSVTVQINKSLEDVWKYYNTPEHIINWNFAHHSWECTNASNNLVEGGLLKVRMQAKDGSFGFDLVGEYDEVIPYKRLRYHLEDGRKVEVIFDKVTDNITKITQNFDPESENSLEMQQNGWQAILDNFKLYSETSKTQ